MKYLALFIVWVVKFVSKWRRLGGLVDGFLKEHPEFQRMRESCKVAFTAQLDSKEKCAAAERARMQAEAKVAELEKILEAQGNFLASAVEEAKGLRAQIEAVEGVNLIPPEFNWDTKEDAKSAQAFFSNGVGLKIWWGLELMIADAARMACAHPDINTRKARGDAVNGAIMILDNLRWRCGMQRPKFRPFESGGFPDIKVPAAELVAPKQPEPKKDNKPLPEAID